MATAEQPLSLRESSGRRLASVLTLPRGSAPTLGLVLLNSGLLPRYCYHRHYVKGARRLAESGLAVLRVDLPGLGDSEGALPEGSAEERWYGIQTGALVGPALSVLEQLVARPDLPDRWVLGGACGGAITALLAAAKAPRGLAGCLTLSLPVCLSGAGRREATQRGAPAADSESCEPAKARPRLHPREAELLMRQYLRKVASPQAWRRLLSGRSDLRGLAEAALSSTGRALERLRSRLSRRRPAIPDDGRMNPAVLPALQAVTRARLPLLVVLAELDPDRDDFRRYLEEPVLAHDRALRRGLRIEVFSRADHTFSTTRDEDALWRLTGSWLRTLSGRETRWGS